MTCQSQIIIQQLNFSTTDNKSLINDLTLSFDQNKTAIVGKNGIGKSTLLKLIIGELIPSSGSISVEGDIAYCPQCFDNHFAKTVMEVLGVDQKIQALERVLQGSLDENDYVLLDDDWSIKERVLIQLKQFGLDYLDLNSQIASLNGGEITRLWLSKTFISKAPIVILDEPTNNLDRFAKQYLYRAVESFQGCLIVVSHDRELLNMMDSIVEMSSLGVNIFGGNYDYYCQQKEINKTAAREHLHASKKNLKTAKQAIQIRNERHQQSASKGEKVKHDQIAAKGSYDKLGLHALKSRSEKTNKKIQIQAERKVSSLAGAIQEHRSKIEVKNEINIRLPKTKVPSNKMVIEIEQITFGYNRHEKPIIKDFSLIIYGPERVAITGKNGSGKTTLVKIIQKELSPQHGRVKLGISKVSYLDQQARALNSQLSILENFKQFNPDILETEARLFLADFLFRKDDSLKIVAHLSGGEKLRALLACVLMSKNPPQLIILDEPTNHLDLECLKNLESTLKCYKGAMMVISHDDTFLKNIGVNRRIDLNRL